ncbi:MAG: hypothetical protein AAB074_03345 [Planctomycetota bacterium]
MNQFSLATVVLSLAGALASAGPNEDLQATWDKGAAVIAGKQAEDGGWGMPMAGKDSDVSMTGLAVSALAGSETGSKKYADAISKGCAYLVRNQGSDGEIHNAGKVPLMTNYKTAIAVVALATADKEKYKEAIQKGSAWLVAFQCQEAGSQKADPADPNYGGAGYDERGGKPRGDMSNTSYMMEALNAADLPRDSEAWKRAVKFLERCQNRSESNDGPGFDKAGVVVGDDGGFFYRPGDGKAERMKLPNGKECIRSYGSMTYAGYKSMLYAGLTKDDARVKSALAWIGKNYTLDENPGMGTRGMYYYYHTFSTALHASGLDEIKDGDGESHKWAEELVAKLKSLQKEDGTWLGDPKWMEDMEPLPTLYSLMCLNKAAKHLK